MVVVVVVIVAVAAAAVVAVMGKGLLLWVLLVSHTPIEQVRHSHLNLVMVLEWQCEESEMVRHERQSQLLGRLMWLRLWLQLWLCLWLSLC